MCEFLYWFSSIFFFFFLKLTWEAERASEPAPICWLFLQMPAMAWAGTEPSPGALNSILVSLVGGRDPVSWIITMFSQDLHRQEAGVRGQGWVSNPDWCGTTTRPNARLLCWHQYQLVRWACTYFDVESRNWIEIVQLSGSRDCTLKHLGSFKKHSCWALIPRNHNLIDLECGLGPRLLQGFPRWL